MSENLPVAQTTENLPAKIIKELPERVLQDMVYSISKGGKNIEGLTAKAAQECRLLMGDIEIYDQKYEQIGNAILCSVMARDHKTGNTAPGNQMEMMMVNGKLDRNASKRALNIAERNAILKLVPDIVKKWLIAKAKNRTLPQLPSDLSRAEPAPDKSSAACFATLKEMEETLHGAGFTDDDFWDYMQHVYEYESRSELTPMQWGEIHARLHGARNNGMLMQELVNQMSGFIMRRDSAPELPAPEVDQAAAVEGEAEAINARPLKDECFELFVKNQDRLAAFFNVAVGKEITELFWAWAKAHVGCDDADQMSDDQWLKLIGVIEAEDYEQVEALVNCRRSMRRNDG